MKPKPASVAALLILLGLAFAAQADEAGFAPLFDGESFNGWEGNLDIFRIEDGAIVGGSLEKPIPHNEFLCTKKEYGDFELRLQAKLVGPGNNAGIQFRSQRIPNHHEVIGYQCDMGAAGERNIWGALYDESRRRQMLAVGDPEKVDKALKPDDWNEFVIRCEGDRVQIWLNGAQTVDYTEPDKSVARRGVIGLQIHGGAPAEASYKEIRLKTLDADRASSAANWPQWRGPHGNGVSDAKGLPTRWSHDQNIVWKAPLPSWSGGTPIIWGDHIFVTSPSPPSPEQAGAQPQERPVQRERQAGAPRGPARGRRPFGGGFGGGYGETRDPGGAKLLLICLSKSDGKELWRREIDEGNRLWRKQNSSSPSPVTDGKLVWVVTGTGAVAAFDFQGQEIWKHNLQNEYGEFGLNWGYASSPLLHDGKLIVQVLHGNNTDDPSYVVALDGATGKTLWRKERPTDALSESPDAYTTPALLTMEGKSLVVVSGGDYVTAHDPQSGEEVWRTAGLNPRRERNYRIVASPVVVGDMLYAPSRKTPLLALDVKGEAPRVVWTWERGGGPDVPTPVSDGKRFYMVEDRGLVTCLDAKSGEVIWGPNRTAEGIVSASPLLADGKLYITNESGVTTVLAAGPEFKILATNELDGSYTLSSLAVADNRLFLRTSTHLYCIGESSR